MKEKPKHLDAFRYFFTLTEKGHEVTDAIPLTAEHCGVKPRTVWRWYKEFNWEIRSVEKRAKIQEEVERKENQTLAQNKINYLNILHKLLDDMIKAGFPVKIESVKDLELVFKTALLLQNAPTEVTKNDTVNVHVNASEFFDEELIDEIIAEEIEAEEELRAEFKAKLEEIKSDDNIINDDSVGDIDDIEEE